jgi:nitrous oxide reductase accessory protein NosL
MTQILMHGTKVKVTSGEFRGTFGVTKVGTNNSTVAYVHVHDVSKDGEWTAKKNKDGSDVVIGVPPAAIEEA